LGYRVSDTGKRLVAELTPGQYSEHAHAGTQPIGGCGEPPVRPRRTAFIIWLRVTWRLFIASVIVMAVAMLLFGESIVASFPALGRRHLMGYRRDGFLGRILARPDIGDRDKSVLFLDSGFGAYVVGHISTIMWRFKICGYWI